MRKCDIKRAFVNDCFGGDWKMYIFARKNDYCKIQFMWSCYIDELCKAGIITQKQYNTVEF